MTPILSLDIHRSAVADPMPAAVKPKMVAAPAVWLLGVAPERRLSLHIAATTLLRPRSRRSRLWWWVAGLYLLLPAAAVTVGVSLWLLRRIAT